MVGEITEQNEELKQKYNDMYLDYTSLIDSEDYKNYQEYLNNKEEADALLDELESLKKEKDELEESVRSLNGELMEILDKPLEFSAGEYICGIDFPAGRYKVYDGKSNFIVQDKLGHLKVNIILSDSQDWGVTEYIHFFEENETIEARSSFIE